MLVKRRCILTHVSLDRTELFRVVKDKDDNISIDLSYKKQGRGAYLSRDREVIIKAKNKDILSRALRHKVDKSIYDQLLQLLEEE
ncbi:MAG: YlxR family protein [Bacilli bacterium]|nr:YlxR family protein [Bacilli bacterium]